MTQSSIELRLVRGWGCYHRETSFIKSLPHGISVTGFVRERFDASHVIVENGRAAFVDTGTNALVRECSRRLGCSVSLSNAAVTMR